MAWRSVVKIVPWLALPALGVWVCHNGGLPWWWQAVAWGYWLLWILIPGVIITRTLLGGSRPLEYDMVIGAGVGTAGALWVWILDKAVFGGIGLLWGWPVLAGLVGALTWRRLLGRPKSGQPDERERLTPWWSWSVATVAGVALVLVGRQTDERSMPPQFGGSHFYVDLLYHLSMQSELSRDWPPQVSQAAGTPLSYHWFADALVTMMHQINGLDPVAISLRLWLQPQLVWLVVATAALASYVCRVWWTAPLAAAALLTNTLRIGNDSVIHFYELILPASPSHNLVTPLLASALLAAMVTLRLRRSPRLVGHVALIGILLFGLSGAKPNGAPTLAAALGVVVVAMAIVRRRFAFRAAGLAILAAFTSWLSLQIVAGSTPGSHYSLFGFVRQMRIWRDLFGPGNNQFVQRGPIVSIGEWTLTNGALLAGLVALAIVAFGGLSWALLLAWGTRESRRDQATWLLIGTVLGGFGALFLLDHPDYAETYFQRAVRPEAAALAAAMAGFAVRRWFPDRPRIGWLVVPVFVSSFGLAIAVGLWADAPFDAAGNRGALLAWLAWPILILVLIWVAFTVGWLLLRPRGRAEECLVPGTSRQPTATNSADAADTADQTAPIPDDSDGGTVEREPRGGSQHREPRHRGLGLLLAAAAIAALPAFQLAQSPRPSAPAPADSAAAQATDPTELSPGRLAAADWIRRHTASTDVLATNSLCYPPSPLRCDARSMWISGLGGRRVWLEGWAYTDQAFAAAAAQRKHHFFVAAPWPNREYLSRVVAAYPTKQRLDELRAAGVKWYVLDGSSVFGPKPAFDQFSRLAPQAFAQDEIRIYAL